MSIYVVVLLVATAVLAGGVVFLLTRNAYQRSQGAELAERTAAEAQARQRLAEVESARGKRSGTCFFRED